MKLTHAEWADLVEDYEIEEIDRPDGRIYIMPYDRHVQKTQDGVEVGDLYAILNPEPRASCVS